MDREHSILRDSRRFPFHTDRADTRKRREITMADFTPGTTTKSAIRRLAAPLTDVTAFDNLVQGVITNNPFQCVPYNASGVTHDPIERTREGYTTRIVYQDAEGKTVAIITARAATIAGFTVAANRIMADADLAAALGGIPVRDFANEKYAYPEVQRCER
jgi:hypothetical protein